MKSAEGQLQIIYDVAAFIIMYFLGLLAHVASVSPELSLCIHFFFPCCFKFSLGIHFESLAIFFFHFVLVTAL